MSDKKWNSQQEAQQLLAFLDASPTAFHATETIQKTLQEAGFVQLNEAEKWQLQTGGKYYVQRNQSAIIAFVMGGKPLPEAGFHMIGAHTDSPGLKIKSNGEMNQQGYVKLGVEVYGGPILSTWLDRELSIAGKVMVRIDDRYQSHLIRFDRPLAIVPNAAIHMNREINKGFEYNRQNHLPAIFHIGDADEKGALVSLLAEHFSVEPEQIGEFDLFLYDTQKAALVGKNEEMIVSGRLDNLASCHNILQALTATENPTKTAVGVFYDHEEIGSATAQGAQSTFLKDILNRMVLVQGGDQEDFWRALQQSFLISADMAHALHPNFAEKHDSRYAPVLNGGPVIKQNGNFRYATTAETTVFFEQLCQKAEVKVQKIINRSDMPCGSTIGPISSTRLGVATVDVGNPMWGMHSIRETAGIEDHWMMTKVFTTFFNQS